MPTEAQPLAIAEYENFRYSTGGDGPLVLRLNLVQIAGVQHRHITKSLDLGVFEVES
jgi:hypothetical protein